MNLVVGSITGSIQFSCLLNLFHWRIRTVVDTESSPIMASDVRQPEKRNLSQNVHVAPAFIFLFLNVFCLHGKYATRYMLRTMQRPRSRTLFWPCKNALKQKKLFLSSTLYSWRIQFWFCSGILEKKVVDFFIWNLQVLFVLMYFPMTTSFA